MFEPNPARFDELKAKFESPNIHAFPYAISNYNGPSRLNIANFEDCSSLLVFDERANETWIHPWHPYKHFEMVRMAEVEVMRLDTFMEQHGIQTVNFLEIDAQGEDMRVVESLGDRIRDVEKIQIEVNVHHSPLYKNSCTREQACAYFARFGFEKHASWKQSVNREENIVFRNQRFFLNPILNFFTGRAEQCARRLNYSAIKCSRVAGFLWSRMTGSKS
jgi:FkbM family methyltransferase